LAFDGLVERIQCTPCEDQTSVESAEEDSSLT
jgi:hypothetical protein